MYTFTSSWNSLFTQCFKKKLECNQCEKVPAAEMYMLIFTQILETGNLLRRIDLATETVVINLGLQNLHMSSLDPQMHVSTVMSILRWCIWSFQAGKMKLFASCIKVATIYVHSCIHYLDLVVYVTYFLIFEFVFFVCAE